MSEGPFLYHTPEESDWANVRAKLNPHPSSSLNTITLLNPSQTVKLPVHRNQIGFYTNFGCVLQHVEEVMDELFKYPRYWSKMREKNDRSCMTLFSGGQRFVGSQTVKRVFHNGRTGHGPVWHSDGTITWRKNIIGADASYLHLQNELVENAAKRQNTFLVPLKTIFHL